MRKSLHRLVLLTALLLCLSALAAGAALAGSASAALTLPVTKVTEPVSTVIAGRVSLPASLPSLPGAATLLGAAVPTAPARALISLRHRNADAGGLQTLLRGTGDTGTLTSAAGYDDSTGLGSPNGASFLSGLAPHSRLMSSVRR